MFSRLPSAAAGVATLLTALAFVGVTSALAQEASPAGPSGETIYSTTCGAGTKEECAKKADMQCDWEVHFSLNPLTRAVEFTIGKTNCRVVGYIPIYKDMDPYSPTFGNCNLLLPFHGMRGGTDCTE